MTHRENVEIKTKYLTIEECRNDCRDIKMSWSFPSVFSRKIYGVVKNDHLFTLSSRRKFSISFEFIGEILEREDGIYMVGTIQCKYFYRLLLYVLISFFSVMGVVLLIQSELVLKIIGILFIIISSVWLWTLTKSDGLYHDLLIKLT